MSRNGAKRCQQISQQHEEYEKQEYVISRTDLQAETVTSEPISAATSSHGRVGMLARLMIAKRRARSSASFQRGILEYR